MEEIKKQRIPKILRRSVWRFRLTPNPVFFKSGLGEDIVDAQIVSVNLVLEQKGGLASRLHPRSLCQMKG